MTICETALAYGRLSIAKIKTLEPKRTKDLSENICDPGCIHKIQTHVEPSDQPICQIDLASPAENLNTREISAFHKIFDDKMSCIYAE